MTDENQPWLQAAFGSIHDELYQLASHIDAVEARVVWDWLHRCVLSNHHVVQNFRAKQHHHLVG